jgi:hypothetical protein
MIVPVVLLAILIIVAAKPSKKALLQTYCSIDQTQTIKGIFVITVFFSHFCTYIVLNKWFDIAMQKYCAYFGQLIVAPFLFYSGYGIFESVKHKGTSYIYSFPKKRILKTLLHFDFAVILFLILDSFIGRHVSISQFLTSLVGWESIGNSNWFIFAILCAYVFSFAGLSIFKGNLKHAAIFITAMTFAYIAIISMLKERSYWINTILAFPLGAFFSIYKDKVEILASKNSFTMWGAFLSIIALILARIKIFPQSSINSQIALLAFCSAIVFVSFHIRLNSKILNWFGANVFGIYILQRLPMNLGYYFHWNSNKYLYFVFCLVSTLLLAVVFRKATNYFDSKFLTK